MTTDRRSYDLGASSEAQGNIAAVVSRLEALIDQRDATAQGALTRAKNAIDGIA